MKIDASTYIVILDELSLHARAEDSHSVLHARISDGTPFEAANFARSHCTRRGRHAEIQLVIPEEVYTGLVRGADAPDIEDWSAA